MPPSELIAAPKQSLFEITTVLESLFDLLEQTEAPEERAATEQEIARVVSNELARKVDSVVWFDLACNSEVAKLEGIAKAIETRIGQINRRKMQVRSMTKAAMYQLGATKLKGDVHTITLREGSESVHTEPGAYIPVEYYRTKEPEVSLDRNKLKAALKGGVVIEGASLVRGEDILLVR